VLVLGLTIGGVACGGGGGGDSAPKLTEAQKTARYCAYFKAHRLESKQQLIGGLITVAPAAIKDDLQSSYSINEAGYESTKRVQKFTQDHCNDPAEELRTP
jgi:hypothetical protein